MNLIKSWGIMRVLRFIFGVIVSVQAIITMDVILGLLGVLVGGMAFFNVGCCGANGCDTTYKKTKSDLKTIDVDYEEVVVK
jgi:hypothetical protein